MWIVNLWFTIKYVFGLTTGHARNCVWLVLVPEFEGIRRYKRKRVSVLVVCYAIWSGAGDEERDGLEGRRIL